MALTDDDKQWITERLEQVETNLLTAFPKWASPVEMRQRSHAAAIKALDAEMESVQDRVTKLEGANEHPHSPARRNQLSQADTIHGF
jgi:hypothetical protein